MPTGNMTNTLNSHSSSTINLPLANTIPLITNSNTNNKEKLAKLNLPIKNPLGVKKCDRILKIASMTVDTLRTNESIRTLTHTLNTLNIDIAFIQESHNGRIDTQISGEYKIFYEVVILNKIIPTTPTMAKTKNALSKQEIQLI